MSNGMPDSEDIGSTLSKYSTAVTTQATMDTGQKVQYDPANGSYPDGTLPSLSKDWGKPEGQDKQLSLGFDDKLPLPAYLEGGGPKAANF